MDETRFAHTFDVIAVGDHVRATYRESFPADSIDAMDAVLVAVDAALVDAGVRAVLFDTRPIREPVQGLPRERAWSWVKRGAHHDAVALLTQSEMLQVQANMTARAQGVRVRSFGDEAAALAFLRTRR